MVKKKTICLKPKGIKFTKPVKVKVNSETKQTWFGKPIGEARRKSIFFEDKKELAFLKSKWKKVSKCS